MWKYIQTDELYHHGILGQKWGVRRYQNKDGTLTLAGKKRYDRDINDNNSKKKENRIVISGPDVSRWQKEDIKRTKSIVDTSKEFISTAKSEAGKIASKKRTNVDLSKMSDSELRNKVNRYNLEQQYINAFEKETTSKGQKWLNNVLDVAGTALTVGSSALAIALSIKELKG